MASIAVSAAMVFGLSACGVGSASPGVASAGSSSMTTPGQTRSSSSRGDANQLLIEWASCMRSHGDSNQADPVVTTNKKIDINWNGAAIPAGSGGPSKVDTATTALASSAEGICRLR
jgi:hypothetical protein